MKERIRVRAFELGFDGCGFTGAGVPDHAGAFAAWLRDGCHGGMGYLERNAAKRSDPGLVLEGARTVILVAVSYHHEGGVGGGNGGGVAGGPTGVVARYARHRDYHDVLAGPLRALREEVDALGDGGTRSLEYIDTGPLLERDLAHRAGLGFVGKHTNLIHRGLGNWFFLGAILTTLELEPDEPAVSRCGRCTRCLGACPTGAITEPYRLDARRCISYLTIEHRGPIPVELRPMIGARVFGCDDCLAVCPWNRFAREGRLMREARLAALDAPSLVGLLEIGEDEFRARFRGTPFARTKRRGLLRNVAVALGNIGDAAVLPALERASQDPEPWIAEHAVWAVERIRARVGGAAGESACSTDGRVGNLRPGDEGEADR